ncbi:MAG: hypothetical protein RJA33_410 [Actinomycetota bacterium]|jgi:hypothetical protein
MSLFEQFLNKGQLLDEEERLALYKFLLINQSDRYTLDAKKLLKERLLISYIARGEILYKINSGRVSYSSRVIGSKEFNESVRELKLGPIEFLSTLELKKFFAQAEIDNVRNYPMGESHGAATGFTINTYPFYDLNYYSNGHGKFLGLIEKIRHTDDELLQKLLAS